MKVNRSWWLGSALAVLVASGVTATQVDATPSTAASTTLAQAVVPPFHIWGHGRTAGGSPWGVLMGTYGLSDGYVIDNKIEVGQSTGWHSHPGPSIVFVVAGSVTNYEASAPHCVGKTYTAGSSFIDQGGTDVHMLRNEGTGPAETIAVQFIPNGEPRRVDVPVVPPNCSAPYPRG